VLLSREQQAAIFHRDVKPSVRDVVREHHAVGERHERIVVSADHERRRRDLPEPAVRSPFELTSQLFRRQSSATGRQRVRSLEDESRAVAERRRRCEPFQLSGLCPIANDLIVNSRYDSSALSLRRTPHPRPPRLLTSPARTRKVRTMHKNLILPAASSRTVYSFSSHLNAATTRSVLPLMKSNWQ
jgi:hypothetical protein